MNDRDRSNINKIRDEITFIENLVQDTEESAFLQDEQMQHAMMMGFIIIGECANKLSDDFMEDHSDIPWMKIIGIRNIAAHGYGQLDMKVVWNTAMTGIPDLKDKLDGCFQ